MPKYNYVAMDAHGKGSKGTLEVASQNEAINRVKEMNLFPTKIVEIEKGKEKPDKKAGPAFKAGSASKAGAKKKGKGFNVNLNIKIPGLSGRVKSKVLTTFTRQLATLVDAGLPLLRGLRVLEKQERNPTLKNIIGELAVAIEGGSTFSEGLAQHPKVFNRLFVNMVKAGELGGVLEVVLNRLSEFMEKAQKIKGKVIAAMFYPIAVMVVAVVILSILMVYVIPRFKEVFAGMLDNAQLPAFTRLCWASATSSRITSFTQSAAWPSSWSSSCFSSAPSLAAKPLTSSSSRCRSSVPSSARSPSPGLPAPWARWSAAASPSCKPSPSSKRPPATSSSATPSVPSTKASKKAKPSPPPSKPPASFPPWSSAWWTSASRPAPSRRCSSRSPTTMTTKSIMPCPP